MSRLLNRASGVSLVFTLLATLLGTAGSSAAAEHSLSAPIPAIAEPAVPAAAPLDSDGQSRSPADGAIQSSDPSSAAPAAPATDIPPAIAASSLEQLVATQADSSAVDNQLKCLAGAIYFEARSESLEGQLAVGRVIVARTRSGRFPASYCGVVYQPAQFSFIRGAAMPSVDAQSHLWQKAVALARIADAGSWQSPAEGALFFHAAHVTPGWRMKRVAQIDHQVFYR